MGSVAAGWNCWLSGRELDQHLFPCGGFVMLAWLCSLHGSNDLIFASRIASSRFGKRLYHFTWIIYNIPLPLGSGLSHVNLAID